MARPGFAASWPGPAYFLFWLAIIVILIFVVSLIISPMGGFDWHVKIGHLFWDFGIGKT
jgi:hypothetical protein